MSTSHAHVTVELKYCERCGGLWLRASGNPGVYCAVCAPQMQEAARVVQPQRRGRPKRTSLPTATVFAAAEATVPGVPCAAACAIERPMVSGGNACA